MNLTEQITSDLIKLFKKWINNKKEINSNSSEYLRALIEFEEYFL